MLRRRRACPGKERESFYAKTRVSGSTRPMTAQNAFTSTSRDPFRSQSERADIRNGRRSEPNMRRSSGSLTTSCSNRTACLNRMLPLSRAARFAAMRHYKRLMAQASCMKRCDAAPREAQRAIVARCQQQRGARARQIRAAARAQRYADMSAPRGAAAVFNQQRRYASNAYIQRGSRITSADNVDIE